jgi:REP element-mobilizing transposase RayT
MARPLRLHGIDYTGPARYFLTFCSLGRTPAFEQPDVAKMTIEQFQRTAAIEHFAVLAYCVMPDHAHLLVEAKIENADLRRFAKMAKQRSGGLYSRWFRQPLWQPGYHERILRSEDDAFQIARYVLNNPLRARLVTDVRHYPYLGSEIWTLDELLGSLT